METRKENGTKEVKLEPSESQRQMSTKDHTYLVKTAASKATCAIDQQCRHVFIFEGTMNIC